MTQLARDTALGFYARHDFTTAGRGYIDLTTGLPHHDIVLVLCAVFVPTAFISGLTGQFYQQFALTIAISTVISAINSLTLSPALAALLLKGHSERTNWFFRGFNRAFGAASGAYSRSVGGALIDLGATITDIAVSPDNQQN